MFWPKNGTFSCTLAPAPGSAPGFVGDPISLALDNGQIPMQRRQDSTAIDGGHSY